MATPVANSTSKLQCTFHSGQTVLYSVSVSHASLSPLSRSKGGRRVGGEAIDGRCVRGWCDCSPYFRIARAEKGAHTKYNRKHTRHTQAFTKCREYRTSHFAVQNKGKTATITHRHKFSPGHSHTNSLLVMHFASKVLNLSAPSCRLDSLHTYIIAFFGWRKGRAQEGAHRYM